MKTRPQNIAVPILDVTTLTLQETPALLVSDTVYELKRLNWGLYINVRYKNFHGKVTKKYEKYEYSLQKKNRLELIEYLFGGRRIWVIRWNVVERSNRADCNTDLFKVLNTLQNHNSRDDE